MMFYSAEEVDTHEDDISTKKEIKIQGSWFQS